MIEEIELDEKYTDAQRAAREKARGSSGRMGTFASGGRETKRDKESSRVYYRDRKAFADKTRSGQRSERDRQARLKKDLLKKLVTIQGYQLLVVVMEMENTQHKHF